MQELTPRDWRGKHIASRKGSTGKRHTAMTGQRAMLFTHVDVEPNTHYRVHLELKRENGNGALCCNLFANRNFDFPQVGFTCDPSGWSLYDMTLKTGDFPPNIPVVLRLWRPSGGKGNVLVRRITMEKISGTDGGHEQPEKPKKVASSVGDATTATKIRPGTRKLGAHKPVTPSPVEVKRTQISQAVQEQRAKKRAARRRKLGAPRPRRPRGEKRTRRRGRKQISHFDTSPTKVMIIAGTMSGGATREAAFKAAGFNTRFFCMGREQGISLESRLLDFRPDWVHMVLDPLPARTPGPRTIQLVRDHAAQAVVTAWWPRDSFDGEIAGMLGKADMALVGGSSAAATYRGSGLAAHEWHEGQSEEEITKNARILGCRLGFMDILKHEFSKERLEGSFKRLLCFVPEGSPGLFACPEEMPDGLSVKFLPFSSCEDFEAAAMDYQPDWLHIHCEKPVRLPWKQALLDLRRKLPRTLVTAWQHGDPPDPGFLALADVVDHMLIGNRDTLAVHVSEGMTHAIHWDALADTGDPDAFASSMAVLSGRLRKMRREFLLNHAGQRVALTIFIGTYNRLEKLKQAVACAIQSAGDASVEVIVNDAGSEDGTIEWLKQKSAADPRVVTIFSGKRTSFTQAFNESLRIAKGKHICWLSDDINCRDATLADMVSLMNTLDPLDMGAFPIWNSWGRTGIHSVRKSRGFLCPTVGCMYTETMRRISGISIDYPYYGQDTDLDYRVLRMGGRIVECITAALDHICDTDILRRTNIDQHEAAYYGQKFEISSLSMARNRHHFPAILLILQDGSDAIRVEHVAACIRKRYSNSCIFMASSSPVPSSGVLSVTRVPVPNSKEYQRYDLVIAVRPDSHELLDPPGKNGLPFVRGLIT